MSHKKAAGFTLIELLVYLALVSGILIMASGFAWNIINTRTKSIATQEVEENGRLAMDKIIQSLRQANDITAPATGASDSQLQLVMRDATKNPTVFSLNSGQLQLSRAGGQAVSLTSNQVRVTSITFKNMSVASGKTKDINIFLTLEHYNPGNRPEWKYVKTFTSTAELRDK